MPKRLARNDRRRTLGARAVEMSSDTGDWPTFPELALVDALANILHYANGVGLDFDAALETARTHFQEEADEET